MADAFVTKFQLKKLPPPSIGVYKSADADEDAAHGPNGSRTARDRSAATRSASAASAAGRRASVPGSSSSSRPRRQRNGGGASRNGAPSSETGGIWMREFADKPSRPVVSPVSSVVPRRARLDAAWAPVPRVVARGATGAPTRPQGASVAGNGRPHPRQRGSTSHKPSSRRGSVSSTARGDGVVDAGASDAALGARSAVTDADTGAGAAAGGAPAINGGAAAAGNVSFDIRGNVMPARSDAGTGSQAGSVVAGAAAEGHDAGAAPGAAGSAGGASDGSGPGASDGNGSQDLTNGATGDTAAAAAGASTAADRDRDAGSYSSGAESGASDGDYDGESPEPALDLYGRGGDAGARRGAPNLRNLGLVSALGVVKGVTEVEIDVGPRRRAGKLKARSQGQSAQRDRLSRRKQDLNRIQAKVKDAEAELAKVQDKRRVLERQRQATEAATVSPAETLWELESRLSATEEATAGALRYRRSLQHMLKRAKDVTYAAGVLKADLLRAIERGNTDLRGYEVALNHAVTATATEEAELARLKQVLLGKRVRWAQELAHRDSEVTEVLELSKEDREREEALQAALRDMRAEEEGRAEARASAGGGGGGGGVALDPAVLAALGGTGGEGGGGGGRGAAAAAVGSRGRRGHVALAPAAGGGADGATTGGGGATAGVQPSSVLAAASGGNMPAALPGATPRDIMSGDVKLQEVMGMGHEPLDPGDAVEIGGRRLVQFVQQWDAVDAISRATGILTLDEIVKTAGSQMSRREGLASMTERLLGSKAKREERIEALKLRLTRIKLLEPLEHAAGNGAGGGGGGSTLGAAGLVGRGGGGGDDDRDGIVTMGGLGGGGAAGGGDGASGAGHRDGSAGSVASGSSSAVDAAALEATRPQLDAKETAMLEAMLEANRADSTQVDGVPVLRSRVGTFSAAAFAAGLRPGQGFFGSKATVATAGAAGGVDASREARLLATASSVPVVSAFREPGQDGPPSSGAVRQRVPSDAGSTSSAPAGRPRHPTLKAPGTGPGAMSDAASAATGDAGSGSGGGGGTTHGAGGGGGGAGAGGRSLTKVQGEDPVYEAEVAVLRAEHNEELARARAATLHKNMAQMRYSLGTLCMRLGILRDPSDPVVRAAAEAKRRARAEAARAKQRRSSDDEFGPDDVFSFDGGGDGGGGEGGPSKGEVELDPALLLTDSDATTDSDDSDGKGGGGGDSVQEYDEDRDALTAPQGPHPHGDDHDAAASDAGSTVNGHGHGHGHARGKGRRKRATRLEKELKSRLMAIEGHVVGILRRLDDTEREQLKQRFLAHPAEEPGPGLNPVGSSGPGGLGGQSPTPSHSPRSADGRGPAQSARSLVAQPSFAVTGAAGADGSGSSTLTAGVEELRVLAQLPPTAFVGANNMRVRPVLHREREREVFERSRARAKGRLPYPPERSRPKTGDAAERAAARKAHKDRSRRIHSNKGASGAAGDAGVGGRAPSPASAAGSSSSAPAAQLAQAPRTADAASSSSSRAPHAQPRSPGRSSAASGSASAASGVGRTPGAYGRRTRTVKSASRTAGRAAAGAAQPRTPVAPARSTSPRREDMRGRPGLGVTAAGTGGVLVRSVDPAAAGGASDGDGDAGGGGGGGRGSDAQPSVAGVGPGGRLSRAEKLRRREALQSRRAHAPPSAEDVKKASQRIVRVGTAKRPARSAVTRQQEMLARLTNGVRRTYSHRVHIGGPGTDQQATALYEAAGLVQKSMEPAQRRSAYRQMGRPGGGGGLADVTVGDDGGGVPGGAAPRVKRRRRGAGAAGASAATSGGAR